jgi:Ca2+-binding RTX toxin-like protein
VVTENAGEGTDLVQTTLLSYALTANIENLTFTGTTGNFVGTGNALVNVITGGAGNDTLDGGAGADSLNGGAGTDTVSYANSSAGVAASLVAAAVNTGGDAAGDVLSNIENMVGSAFNDTLIGSSGVNVLTGGAGDDTLIGGAGADTLDGGTGIDTASYAASTVGVVVSLVAGAANTGGDAAGDVLTNIENLTGSALKDVFTGDANNNVFIGSAGADTLNGGAGIDTASYATSSAGVVVSLVAGAINTGGDAAGDVLTAMENLTGSALKDVLTGDANNNVLIGGAGADTLDGGAGSDTASYATSTAGVTVSLVAGAVNTGGDAAGDVLTNIENLTGSAFNDVLIGNTGANVLTGGAGNDTLTGGTGTDTFSFQKGDGIDRITDFSASGGEIIQLLNYGISSFTQLQGMISQQGADVVINIDPSNQITLAATTASQLTAANFHFT